MSCSDAVNFLLTQVDALSVLEFHSSLAICSDFYPKNTFALVQQNFLSLKLRKVASLSCGNTIKIEAPTSVILQKHFLTKKVLVDNFAWKFM